MENYRIRWKMLGNLEYDKNTCPCTTLKRASGLKLVYLPLGRQRKLFTNVCQIHSPVLDHRYRVAYGVRSCTSFGYDTAELKNIEGDKEHIPAYNSHHGLRLEIEVSDQACGCKYGQYAQT